MALKIKKVEIEKYVFKDDKIFFFIRDPIKMWPVPWKHELNFDKLKQMLNI